MAVKLTLTVDQLIIERAKSYAKQTGRSLSEIIETYLDNITSENHSQKLSPKLKKLVGSVKLPKDFDEVKAKRNYLEKKYK